MPTSNLLLESSVQWALHHVEQKAARPIVLGLSAPQGSGKTTLVRALVPALEARGLRAVAVSIDDFYLRREEQVALAGAHRGNRILEHRGAPGTHDIALGDAMLDRLARLGPRETMRLVAYDKTAHSGRGDRACEDRWPTVTGPLDVVLLEGWCWAFQPVPEGALADPDLVPVNAALPRYRSWQSRVSALMAWRARELESIVAWRVEAEERSRAEGRPALDAGAAEDYIRRFLPVYRTYADTVARGRWGDRVFGVALGADRSPRNLAEAPRPG
jgi:D-glycerate 3-kinase